MFLWEDFFNIRIYKSLQGLSHSGCFIPGEFAAGIRSSGVHLSRGGEEKVTLLPVENWLADYPLLHSLA